MLIGIDLLWVRPKICGGTESVIRNLMNGFGMYDGKNEYILFAGKDVADTFKEYEKYPNMKIHICDTLSMKRIKRIAWENSHLDKLARSLNVDLMFIPVYSKPNSLSTNKGGIPYITVIHDLQALHYPEYFSKAKIIFAQRSWKKACNESSMVVAISEYCKDDLEKHYPVARDKVVAVYNPIMFYDKAPSEDNQNKDNSLETNPGTCQNETNTDKNESDIFDTIKAKYGIEKDTYFYTVSSMLPHKNLVTLINVMKAIKDADAQNPEPETSSNLYINNKPDTSINITDLKNFKLVVSGVGGNKEGFLSKVKEAGVEEFIVDTGFVSNEERDSLYENCGVFLFPSMFEGFGMPPVEALIKGARVVTTKCASIEEVTQKKAVYVDDPLNENEWIDKICETLTMEKKKHEFPRYNLKNVTTSYLKLFDDVEKFGKFS